MFETYFWKSIVGIDDQQARLSTAALQQQQRVVVEFSQLRRKDQASLGTYRPRLRQSSSSYLAFDWARVQSGHSCRVVKKIGV